MTDNDAHPMGSTFRDLSSKLADHVGSAVANAVGADDTPTSRTVQSLWRGVPTALGNIDAALSQLGQHIHRTATDADLTNDAKTRVIGDAVTATKGLIEQGASDIAARTADILKRARDAVYPSRPRPFDAAQEAALAGAKADVRMMLDAAPDAASVVAQVGTLLRRALDTGDGLTAWLLASTPWPADYLSTRQMADHSGALADTVDDAVNVATPGRETAVSLYQSLTDGQRGLPLANLLASTVAGSLFNDVAKWRPATWSPQPPLVRA
jgi:hypothetical protein